MKNVGWQSGLFYFRWVVTVAAKWWEWARNWTFPKVSAAVALRETFNTTMTVYRLYSSYNWSAKSVKFCCVSITYSFDTAKKNRASLWASVPLRNKNNISTDINWKSSHLRGVHICSLETSSDEGPRNEYKYCQRSPAIKGI